MLQKDVSIIKKNKKLKRKFDLFFKMIYCSPYNTVNISYVSSIVFIICIKITFFLQKQLYCFNLYYFYKNCNVFVNFLELLNFKNNI